jgi:hypothetical protein
MESSVMISIRTFPTVQFIRRRVRDAVDAIISNRLAVRILVMVICLLTGSSLSFLGGCDKETNSNDPVCDPAGEITDDTGRHKVTVEEIETGYSPVGHVLYVLDVDSTAYVYFTRSTTGVCTESGVATIVGVWAVDAPPDFSVSGNFTHGPITPYVFTKSGAGVNGVHYQGIMNDQTGKSTATFEQEIVVRLRSHGGKSNDAAYLEFINLQVQFRNIYTKAKKS